MACMVMAHIVMAHMVRTYIVMAHFHTQSASSVCVDWCASMQMSMRADISMDIEAPNPSPCPDMTMCVLAYMVMVYMIMACIVMDMLGHTILLAIVQPSLLPHTEDMCVL